jgi:hypothetical protein
MNLCPERLSMHRMQAKQKQKKQATFHRSSIISLLSIVKYRPKIEKNPPILSNLRIKTYNNEEIPALFTGHATPIFVPNDIRKKEVFEILKKIERYCELCREAYEV